MLQYRWFDVARRYQFGGGYNYESTSIRLQFDRDMTVRRPTTRSGCCAAAYLSK